MIPAILFAAAVACNACGALGASLDLKSSNSSSCVRLPCLIEKDPAADGAQCSILHSKLGSKVSFPNSTVFQNEQNGSSGYWTQQEASLTPACRVTPTCTQDVALAVSIMSSRKCRFAVRGGGHMGWAGSANIANGVTIDLGALNSVSVSSDHSITSVGGGARWESVYLKLDAMELAVSGGRVADVGVGGLTTGGGNSFFAPREGFVCDNVENFEVVLGTGETVNANNYENRALFIALKGGSNNLGIVTRFDLKTFKQGKLWGGFIIYPITSAAEQFQYLEDFVTASGNGVDDYATIINSYIFLPAGPSFVANQYTYTKPEAFPAVLKNFTDLQPQLQSTMRITNLTDITIELGAGTPNGFRQLFGTATFGNNAGFFADMFALAEKVFQPIQSIADFQASFVLQPMPKSILRKSVANGPNSLGLTPASGNLVWLDLTLQWSNPSDDAAVNNATQTLLRQSISLAKSRGLYNEFIYLNYALQAQDPIAGYGPSNVANLKATSRQYDPEQVFQKLVPGGFKLSRQDTTCC